MGTGENLPDYAPLLSAYHRAFAAELRQMIGGLPIKEGDRALEVACGEGAYSRWLVERVGDSGVVVAVDLSTAYLELSQRLAGPRPIQFAAANIDRLPFADDTFDLVWCAQSLYSLPDPVEALRRMRRVARPGGAVAILENDTLHHILLPWPIEVELAVRHAEWRSLVEQSDKPRKFYVARQLRQVCRAAGLVDCQERTWATERQAPLDPPTRAFLEHYLRDLRKQAGPHLEPHVLDRFNRLVDPSSDQYLLDWPDLSVTCLDHVVHAVKPDDSLPPRWEFRRSSSNPCNLSTRPG